MVSLSYCVHNNAKEVKLVGGEKKADTLCFRLKQLVAQKTKTKKQNSRLGG